MKESIAVLKEYILNWENIKEIRPKNEDVFINNFIQLLVTLDDDRDIEFDGEGSYFGKQVTLTPNRIYGADSKVSFEIAYTNKEIRVYTANHFGYWTPEFININYKDERFDRLRMILFNLLTRVFGL